MRKFLALVAFSAMLAVAAFAADTSATKRLDQASTVIQQMTTGSAGIPDSVLKDAKCIAVVPGLVKGAFIVGAEHGDGVATCRTSNGWSAPAFFKVSGGSFGAQIGGQKTDLVMMIMNEQGMDALMKGHFKVGAEASGAAGPVGREAAASGGWKAAILTYSRSKGAFAGVDLNGAELHTDTEAMSSLYNQPVTFQQALQGTVPPPPQATAFLQTIQNARATAASNQ